LPETLMRAQTGAHMLAGEMQVRAIDTETRQFTGIAVPWGDEVEIWGLWREAFDPGAVQDSDDALVFYRHGTPIGRLISARDTDTGWEVTGVISSTPTGDEAYTLLRDGVLDRLSVGFEPIEYRVSTDADGAETVVHTKVRVREVSIVPFPAYDNARVSQVRHAERNPTPTQGETVPEALTRAMLDEALTLDRAETDRRLDVLGAQLAERDGGSALPQFESLGHFVRALASGDESAALLHREYTGAGLANAVSRNTWLADAIRLVEKRRKVTETFSRQTLPSEGMTLEYAKLKSDGMKVSKQEKEGDNLPFGKIDLTTATANVETYGGYTEFSRQLIERGQPAYLTTAFKAMGIKYAVETEGATRAALNKAIAGQKAAGATLALDVASAKRNDWLGLLVDAVEMYEDLGFTLDGSYVSKDVFKVLLALEDTKGNSVMNVYGDGINQTGTVDISGLLGRLANVNFKLLPGAAAGTVSFYDEEAITTFESSGAPYQLQDENIINLTKQFSVYGYLATATQFPAAIVPVVKPAAGA